MNMKGIGFREKIFKWLSQNIFTFGFIALNLNVILFSGSLWRIVLCSISLIIFSTFLYFSTKELLSLR